MFGQRESNTRKTANGMFCRNRSIGPAAAPSRALMRHQFQRQTVRVGERQHLLIKAPDWPFNAEATRCQPFAPVAERAFGYQKSYCGDLAGALAASGRARPGEEGQNGSGVPNIVS